MALGIVLHAALPFIPWRDWDGIEPFALNTLVALVHGFRMPLFFLLSGFFTAMLMHRRGLRALVGHRVRRVGLPLLVSVFTILPAVWASYDAGWAIMGESAPGGLATDSSGAEDGFRFAHLWFLWVLLWQMTGFVALVLLWRLCLGRAAARLIPQRHVVPTRRILLWSLPPLAAIFQQMMSGWFGPDTSETLLTAPRVLLYYACFFGFGALVHNCRARDGTEAIEALGRRWIAHLGMSVLVVFPFSFAMRESHRSVSLLLQVAFAWMMAFGLIGLFRRCLSAPRFLVHYLSDASYWVYLAHLPLVLLAQGAVTHLGLSAMAGFAVMCVAVTAVLLASYHYAVRYTPIGRLLNGRRTRRGDRDHQVALATTFSHRPPLG